jgi:Asp-tRNA(Asn)/Glu-tRNA(Gln) amidotransferase A subunit family amidase
MPEIAALALPVAALVAAFRSGEISPVAVCEAALERAEAVDPVLHAFVRTTPVIARAQARAAETAYRNGSAASLAGVPVSVKDTFAVEGVVTTCGSLLHDPAPARADSGAVARLRAAGAVFVGKTATAEFGQSATTDGRLGPDTGNPWDPGRTPGGSSGGAAASVGARSCTAALGSDGGGSIRIPAAFCGLVGLKPTYGRCRDEGGFRGMSAFVCPGPLARSVADARAVYAVLADDPGERRAIAPLRIAWCARPEGRPVDPELLAIVEGALRSAASLLGAEVVPADLPLDGWNDAFGPIVLAEELAERGHLEARADQLSDYERRSLEQARALDPALLAAAPAVHAAVQGAVDGVLARYDLIATPATAVPAFPLGERPREIAGERVSRLWGAFPFSVPFNVSGHPALSLPVGLAAGLPVGLQLVGRRREDHALLDAAAAIEEALGLTLAAPDVASGSAA